MCVCVLVCSHVTGTASNPLGWRAEAWGDPRAGQLFPKPHWWKGVRVCVFVSTRVCMFTHDGDTVSTPPGWWAEAWGTPRSGQLLPKPHWWQRAMYVRVDARVWIHT